MWGTFDLLVFEVILGSFGALVSKWHITWKTAGRRVKRSEILESGVVVTCIWGAFGVQGQFGIIRCACLKMACNSNTWLKIASVSKVAGCRAKLTEIWAQIH